MPGGASAGAMSAAGCRSCADGRRRGDPLRIDWPRCRPLPT
jgi:hypothetical protein